MTTHLIVDTTYLCHRARHTTGGLTHRGDPTGVAFGVLRDIEKFTDMFSADVCVFAFDYGGPGLRHEVYPKYKAHRRAEDRSEEEEEELQIFFDEVRKLYSEILPALGFRNIFRFRGYEGDDIVAQVAQDIKAEDSGMIITGDHDLFQCLRSNVHLYRPSFAYKEGRVMTLRSFREEWGILPDQWAQVIAIAGCVGS